jgi:hypothetical protein
MSEPKPYEIWAKQAELIHRHLGPSKYLLSMDEIRPEEAVGRARTAV